MSDVVTLATNKIFMAGIFAIALCQILKMIILSIKERKFNLKHLFELSGMPSTHTATAVAITTMIYIQHGISTFFIIMIFATLYIIDEVVWIEKSVSVHSRLFNRLFQRIKARKSKWINEKLRERWGHTADEIVIGVIAGFFIVWLIEYLI